MCGTSIHHSDVANVCTYKKLVVSPWSRYSEAKDYSVSVLTCAGTFAVHSNSVTLYLCGNYVKGKGEAM